MNAFTRICKHHFLHETEDAIQFFLKCPLYLKEGCNLN